MATQRREFHPPHIYEDDTCYFITASTLDHQRLLDANSRRSIFRNILMAASKRQGISLYAWVVLANHYHLLLQIPSGGSLPAFVRVLHSESARRLNALDGVPGRKVWRQYWDRFPRGEDDFWSFFNYIHINPLKHGYVHVAREVGGSDWTGLQVGQFPDVHECLVGYPHSTYARYVREYGIEWVMDVWLRHPIRASLVDWDE